jgi:hypothetical protein
MGKDKVDYIIICLIFLIFFFFFFFWFLFTHFFRVGGNTVKVHSDITLVLPIIVAETFAKNEKLASKL